MPNAEYALTIDEFTRDYEAKQPIVPDRYVAPPIAQPHSALANPRLSRVLQPIAEASPVVKEISFADLERGSPFSFDVIPRSSNDETEATQSPIAARRSSSSELQKSPMNKADFTPSPLKQTLEFVPARHSPNVARSTSTSTNNSSHGAARPIVVNLSETASRSPKGSPYDSPSMIKQTRSAVLEPEPVVEEDDVQDEFSAPRHVKVMSLAEASALSAPKPVTETSNQAVDAIKPDPSAQRPLAMGSLKPPQAMSVTTSVLSPIDIQDVGNSEFGTSSVAHGDFQEYDDEDDDGSVDGSIFSTGIEYI
jgi:hypothetical protein